jgi:hypothetical protein
MKRRTAPILTFAIALLLVCSLALAAKRKGHVVSSDRVPAALSEEAMRSELLDAVGDHPVKLPGIGKERIRKVIHASAHEGFKEQVRVKQPEK